MDINLQIKLPAVIESVIFYFVLRRRKRRYGFAFRRIRLRHRIYAKVDPDDYRQLSQYDWHLLEDHGRCYAVRFNERLIWSMHRQIMNAPKGTIVDHKNRDGLDNTKRNLRFATHAQNNANRMRKKENATSRYKGVSRQKNRKNFRASLCCNEKYIHLGMFENEDDAAHAYDAAAKIHHGEFAQLNFP